MRWAFQASLNRLRRLLLAAAATGATQLGGHAHAADPATTTPAVEPAQDQVISAAEQKSWAEAQSLETAEAYQRYLELFPTGRFAEEAFRMMIEKSYKGPAVRTRVLLRPGAALSASGRIRTVAAASLSLY